MSIQSDFSDSADYVIVYTKDTIPSIYNKNYKPTFDTLTSLYRYYVDEGELGIYYGKCPKLNDISFCKDSVLKYLSIDYLKIESQNGRIYEAKNKDQIIQLFQEYPGDGSSFLRIKK